MVIGLDHEAQLIPFHQFECTGYDDEFVQDIDITDEVLADAQRFEKEGEANPLQKALEWNDLEDRTVEDPYRVDLSGEHKYRYAVVQAGKLVQAIDRTNPNYKWDWYAVGGRWTGFLKLKEGYTGIIGQPGLMTEPAKAGQADSTCKGNVDWEGMGAEAAAEAAERWDNARALAPNDWESWESVRGRFSHIEDAQDFYNGQTAVKAIRGENPWGNLDEFLADRETYVKRAEKAAVCPFAILYKGEWIERGKWGWFGVVSDETERDTWMDKAWELIQSLPDDELITMVDCHI